MNFQERLKNLRAEAGLTQKGAADALGITARQYQRFELGEQLPGYENLIKIADFFDVSIDWLTGRTDQ